MSRNGNPFILTLADVGACIISILLLMANYIFGTCEFTVHTYQPRTLGITASNHSKNAPWPQLKGLWKWDFQKNIMLSYILHLHFQIPRRGEFCSGQHVWSCLARRSCLFPLFWKLQSCISAACLIIIGEEFPLRMQDRGAWVEILYSFPLFLETAFSCVNKLLGLWPLYTRGSQILHFWMQIRDTLYGKQVDVWSDVQKLPVWARDKILKPIWSQL